MTRTLLFLALVVGVLSSAACERGGAQPRPTAPPAVPVGVATVEQKIVPVQVTAVGNVQAFTTVSVKSQVAGQIVKVHFTEGDEVKQAQPLFTIDPRPMEASVRQLEAALGQRRAEVVQAQANLERDAAQMENARVQEQRYRSLFDKELIAREQYDQVRTNFAAFQATVLADRAAVENAKAAVQSAQAMVDNARLQLSYTIIHAPMDGRTGNLLVQAGNVLKGNDDNPLVVIAQLQPIYVSFTVPERYLGDIKKYRAEGRLKVEARLDGGQKSAVGNVTFMNNTVDMTTGTIQLKATFANADHALWPGQYVDVALTLTTEDAIVVPTQAVQTGQKGSFVFVVKPDLTVESRPVKVGRRLARELTVEQGLKPGERVVTDGQLRLIPGARVEIKPQRAS